MYFKTQKVGRITVAIGFLAFGVAVLIDNFQSGWNYTGFVIKLWPLLLIGFGAEYLVRTMLGRHEEQEARVRFDFGGAFLLAFVVLLVAGLTNLGTFIGSLPGHITIGSDFGIRPQLTRSETQEYPATDVKTLEIEDEIGSVTLEPNSDTAHIRVEATYSARGFNLDEVRQQLDQVQLNFSGGEIARISAQIPNLNDPQIKYVIYAPPGLKIRTNTDIGTVSASGYKGDLDLHSKIGSIRVESGSGSVTAESNSGLVSVSDFSGPVTAETTVGSLDLRNITGTLQLKSGTGSINVSQFQSGSLTAEARTGTIHASTSSPLSGDVTLKNQTGSVSLSVPRESSMRVTAQSRNGSISAPSFLTVTRNGASSSGAGTAGDGKYNVSMETSTGSVNLQAN